MTEESEFQRVEGEFKPPLTETEPSEELSSEETGGKSPLETMKGGALPIHPALPKLFLSVEGNILAELTHYEGFRYTEQELQYASEIICALGLNLDPRIQALVAIMGLHMEKFGGYMAWRRGGSKVEKSEQKEVE